MKKQNFANAAESAAAIAYDAAARAADAAAMASAADGAPVDDRARGILKRNCMLDAIECAANAARQWAIATQYADAAAIAARAIDAAYDAAAIAYDAAAARDSAAASAAAAMDSAQFCAAAARIQ